MMPAVGNALPYRLPPRAKAILLELSKALVVEPEDLVIRDKEEALLRRCQTLVAEMPRFFRVIFLVLLYFFDRATILFGFGPARFIRLKPESQRLYAARWHKAQIALLAEAFKALRGCVMSAYFSHPDVWAYIGYDPKKHVDDRIRLREELVRRNAAEDPDVTKAGGTAA